MSKPKRAPVRKSAKSRRADRELLESIEYPGPGAWRVAVGPLIYQLHGFGGHWSLEADRLAELVQGSDHPPLDEEQIKLTRVQSVLAAIKNHPKADLTQDQQSTLKVSLNDAIKRTGHRLLGEIPGEIKKRERAIRRAGKHRGLIESLVAKHGANAGDARRDSGVSGSGQDAFHELRQVATTKLKGIERRIVELICENDGACALKELAIDAAISWDMPCDDAFNSAKKRINRKLKKAHWKIYRHDGRAKAKNLGRK